MSTIYQECIANNPDDMNALIQCVADRSEESTGSLASGVNAFYLIFAGALVFFMQIGFAMLCAGSIRAKNVKNVILWNLLDSCGGGTAFWAVGYAFAYGGDNQGGPKTFIGNTNFFLMNNDVDYEFWFFQFAFACALSSIVAGTIAERTQMTAYLCYSIFLAGFVYPVVAHAHWSYNGFLSTTAVDPLFGSGVLDLAGSGPVHMTGGVAALVAAIILGPRIGRFYDEQGEPLEEPAEFTAHSTSLQMLGTFCLWFGWYGFNPGSTLTISSENRGDVAALVTINTTLAACTGALSAMFTSTLFDWRRSGIATYDVTYTMNGCLTGLVAITAGCASVEPWAAVAIGIGAGWWYLLGSRLLIRLKIDDAVDAIPVHMLGGAWGVLATGLFTTAPRRTDAYGENDNIGWFYEWGRGSGNFSLIGAQLVSILFIFGWTSVTMGIYFYVLKLVGWLRIDPLEEMVGMDISRHKGSAYDIDAPTKDLVNQLNDSRSSRNLKISKADADSDPVVYDDDNDDDNVVPDVPAQPEKASYVTNPNDEELAV